MNSKSMNLLEAITQSLDELRKSERKVADTILSDPSKATDYKLAELAKIAGVSEPTVIRFCSVMGCDGFQDMKIRLAKSLAFGLSASHSQITGEDSLNELVGKIFDYNLSSLDWARSKLDIEAFEKAANLILEAKTLTFIGFGASSIVAMDAQQKFPLFGKPCNAIVDIHQMVIAASMMGPEDVLVSISNTGSTREIAQTTRVAQDHGAKTLGITGRQSPLLRYCDVSIIVETLENTNLYTPTISRVAALVVIDILSTAVALRSSAEHRYDVAEMKKFLADIRSIGFA